MGFECGTDFPPHTRITDSRRTLPRRDAMTSPINVGTPSGVPTSLLGPLGGV